MKKQEQIKILAVALFRAAKGKNDKEIESLIKNFKNYLKKKRLMSFLPQIVREIKYIEHRRRGILNTKMICGFDLSTRQCDEFKKIVKKKTGKNIEMENKIDRSLIGGLVVRYADKIIDLSVKRKLNQLRKHLIN